MSEVTATDHVHELVDADEQLGTSDGWPRSTLVVIHAILVEGRDPSEVSR